MSILIANPSTAPALVFDRLCVTAMVIQQDRKTLHKKLSLEVVPYALTPGGDVVMAEAAGTITIDDLDAYIMDEAVARLGSVEAAAAEYAAAKASAVANDLFTVAANVQRGIALIVSAQTGLAASVNQ